MPITHRLLRAATLMSLLTVAPRHAAQDTPRPNIILMMADDLGYADTGFNGNPVIQTPHLDALAQRGAVLTHFYAGNSVCSPTRATCLTGRHHDRMGIWGANTGHLPSQEITLAHVLKEKGYTTGHFGKWHLGTLSRTLSAKGPRRRPDLNYAPPWERGYDASFVTESAVRTWDPGAGNRAVDNPFYENGVAVEADAPSLKGGAARVVVDRMVPFIEDAAAQDQPFLAVAWFHAPHQDVMAGPDYLAMYPGHGQAAHYYGCITEMDEQVGRIVATLEASGTLDNTLLFFCSDNGPESSSRTQITLANGRNAGRTAGLRGRKRALYDGGVRVPSIAVWPGVIPPGTRSDAVLSTLDYFPTVAKLVNYDLPDARPIDGEDMRPALTGQQPERAKPIAFRYTTKITSLVKGRYKLLLPANELYDLSYDRFEEHDIADDRPQRVAEMKQDLVEIFDSIKQSHAGADYHDDAFKPLGGWPALKTEPKKETP